uniref:Intraflagellar transport protein 74 homolog n=1 Tax=Brugia pahangi TaxID=6280 RepID=A0A0N4TW66_BRUPA
MTSRPTTARPKTSAGTRATSARLRKPSSTANAIQYVSRAAMVPESTGSVTPLRTMSQISSIPTTRLNTAMRNESVRNRLGTGQNGRLPTGTIQAAPRGTTMRPVTQQGLTGVKTATRIGSGRFVIDKSYYMSLFRAQMNNLMNEIDKLRDDLNRGERDRQNLLIYEKKAEEEANIIRTLQGRLLDCNKIMDLINTNSELHEIENELSKLHKQRNNAEKNLADLVENRRMKEDEIRLIENKIEEQKAQNNAKFHSMNPTIYDAYEELKKENEKLLEEYRMKQKELNELNEKKEQFDEHLAKFTLKQQAAALYERLAELEEKKMTIVDEINAEGTPDEQRERLLQTVIRTTNEIDIIQKQLDDVNEQIEQLKEELREFDIEMENVAGERNEKYRELKLKEMQIDEFLNSYDNLKAEEESQIDVISTEVVRKLELISTNITNLSLISGTANLDLTTELAEFNENYQLYVCLQQELNEMNKLEEKLQMANKQISEEIKEMNEKMDEFENINNFKAHKEQKRQELENCHQMLMVELPKINNSYQKLMDELEQTKFQLEKNDDYIKFKNVEKKWQCAEKNLNVLREEAAQRELETNYQVFKEKVKEKKKFIKIYYYVDYVRELNTCMYLTYM